MDDPPASRPVGGLMAVLRDASGGSGFVSTEHKLSPPVPRPHMVDRSALIGRLRAMDGDILAVSAPAGYGKTTFAGAWVESDDRPAAWLSVDAADNDPVVLMTNLVLALDRISPVDPSFISVLSQPAVSMATVLPRFAGLVSDVDRPFLLVIDDVHLLTGRDALAVLAVVVADLRPGSMVAFVGRTLPPLRFGRMRVKRAVLEVGAQDLALAADDAARLFAGFGLELRARDVVTLVERTEGWVAALYLAVLSLRGHEHDMAAAVAEFAGDHRLVADYLRDELLADLDPDVATFLLGASCLDRLSGTFCDAVLDRTGSAGLLDELERQNLLITRLDDRRESYRLHQLLVELLQAELRQRDPAMAIAVHARASAWFEAAGDIDRAIAHASSAGDRDRVELLIARHVGVYSGQGRHGTIRRWLALFPSDAFASSPLLAVVMAESRLAAGDGDGAAYWLAQAEAGVPDRHPRRAMGWVAPVAVALYRSLLLRLPAHEMSDEAAYAYHHLPHGDWRSLSCLLRGAAEFLLGDQEAAVELLSEGVAESADTPTVRGLCLAHLAVVDVERGAWDQAATLARRGREVLVEHSLEAMPGQFLVTAVSCLVEAHAGRVAEAQVDRTLTGRHMAGFLRVAPWANFQARLALARANVIMGDRVAARNRLNEAETFLVHVPDAIRVKEQVAQVRNEWLFDAGPQGIGPSSLTTAELRVLNYLPTHLTLAEIADRLYVSRNTVKSHTIAIYRKLGTSSRAGAVRASLAAGLIDAAGDPRGS